MTSSTEMLDLYDTEAIYPDDFVGYQFCLRQERVLGAAKNHRASLQKPPKRVEAYLDTLASQGLVKTAFI